MEPRPNLDDYRYRSNRAEPLLMMNLGVKLNKNSRLVSFDRARYWLLNCVIDQLKRDRQFRAQRSATSSAVGDISALASMEEEGSGVIAC